ncbi:GNAT family N-acetyltransferase [Azospirillum sp. RWY-5-1]|uniref:GNAT family N-acetyltransferase n=1 Tax=Azospirillum oleiclasticum TaxID=2735135 RepID=A0ABX2T405_9PROT|nr:GNAT family N-acetyltransferase [Azospirillum oleiclasticum]NYZ11871.1 GNAT family N-acetyltransferase [Azospirillum oleiclasticum]NYZ19031.1 GNAT family N-acetyltransferase [Azospirillum oleiclasticum]
MPVFRKLFPAERGHYRDHLLRLGVSDRYARFAGTVGDAVIDRHVARMDWTRTTVIAAVERGAIVGAVELCTDRTVWPDNAEIAISVEAAHQSGGIGSVLVRRALTVARNRSVARVHLLCLAENRRMRAMMRRLGARQEADGGEVTAIVELPRPSQYSLALEALEDGAGAVNSLLDHMHGGRALRAA